MEPELKPSEPPKQDKKLPNDNLPAAPDLTDPVALGNVLLDVAEKAQPLLKQFLEKYEFDIGETVLDPLHMREAYMEFVSHLMANPGKLAELQMKFWHDWMHLWRESAIRFMGGQSQELYRPEKGDRRFNAPAWQESAVFDFIKQSYLLTSRWMEHVVDETEGLDEETRQKIDFSTRQFISAMAPSNFLFTNPEVLQETLDTHGENLIKGLENLIEDMERGKGRLRISTTDYKAFEVGGNLAVTPGKVIYQNDLMQLIQYEPATEKVFKRPLLIVPPWINKYYILDLQPKNSFIKWLVDQGHTVFTISWVNPDTELAQKEFGDYMEEGVLDAMAQVKKITDEPDCNMIGYCLGGTLLAATLAWLAAKGKQDSVASATYLTTLIDFDKSGDLKIFIDDAQIRALDKMMEEHGVLNAGYMRHTFSMLRSNDMIWAFVVNNYLMGREPFPFDLLYWNDDSTNMPAAMHGFYLRKFYRDNMLALPGGIEINGCALDMADVKTPGYFLSTKEDHIAPWPATYDGMKILGGKNTFVMAASGHVAGVVNPPAKNKYCYWAAAKTPGSADEWFNGAKRHEGSWWPHWQKWIGEYAGEKVPARKPGGGKLKPIEDAPGSYVKMKAD